jgi:SAM-dependent methyltransferase
MESYRAASLDAWSSVAPDWAELSSRVDRQLQAAADWMLEALALTPGERLLELAGGPGTLSVRAAHAVGSAGQVIYSDFSAPMVEAAQERLRAEGLRNVDCRTMDAEAIDLGDKSVDAVACRMGYMLMADPAAALRETRRVLADGGRVALAVWADAASNPWGALPMQAVMAQLDAPPPPADAPGLWALGDEARLADTLERAGFGSIQIQALDDMVEYESADAWIEMTRRLAGPLRALWANLDDDTREAIEARIREAAKPYEVADGRIALPERILVASGRAL